MARILDVCVIFPACSVERPAFISNTRPRHIVGPFATFHPSVMIGEFVPFFLPLLFSRSRCTNNNRRLKPPAYGNNDNNAAGPDLGLGPGTGTWARPNRTQPSPRTLTHPHPTGTSGGSVIVRDCAVRGERRDVIAVMGGTTTGTPINQIGQCSSWLLAPTAS